MSRHKEMVESYRLQREYEIQMREVASADERNRPVTFKEWLKMYRYEKEE